MQAVIVIGQRGSVNSEAKAERGIIHVSSGESLKLLSLCRYLSWFHFLVFSTFALFDRKTLKYLFPFCGQYL